MLRNKHPEIMSEYSKYYETVDSINYKILNVYTKHSFFAHVLK